eukprot:403338893
MGNKGSAEIDLNQSHSQIDIKQIDGDLSEINNHGKSVDFSFLRNNSDDMEEEILNEISEVHQHNTNDRNLNTSGFQSLNNDLEELMENDNIDFLQIQMLPSVISNRGKDQNITDQFDSFDLRYKSPVAQAKIQNKIEYSKNSHNHQTRSRQQIRDATNYPVHIGNDEDLMEDILNNTQTNKNYGNNKYQQ